MPNETKVAVVTGGNRGIGLETCRQLAERGYRVILTSRDTAQGEKAAQALAGQGAHVTVLPLDVTNPESIRAFHRQVEADFGGVDVLVNNAAINIAENQSVLDIAPEVFTQTFQTNFFGPLMLCQAFVPGMIRRGYGRVVNLSSGLGQLTTMGNNAPAYSISKTALVALTRQVAAAARGHNVLVNAVDPGWVKTDMGGPGAERPVEEGAQTSVWLATLPDDGPTGGLFKNKNPIPW